MLPSVSRLQRWWETVGTWASYHETQMRVGNSKFKLFSKGPDECQTTHTRNLEKQVNLFDRIGGEAVSRDPSKISFSGGKDQKSQDFKNFKL